MKWIWAGLGLAFTAFVAGLASIVLGYRQVIGRYIRGNQPRIDTNERQDSGRLAKTGRA